MATSVNGQRPFRLLDVRTVRHLAEFVQVQLSGRQPVIAERQETASCPRACSGRHSRAAMPGRKPPYGRRPVSTTT